MSRARTIARWTWRGLATLSAIVWATEGLQQTIIALGHASPVIVPPHTIALAFFVTAGWMLKSGWSS